MSGEARDLLGALAKSIEAAKADRQQREAARPAPSSDQTTERDKP